MPFDILKPGRNVWRIEHARRSTVLVDGAAFFEAVRGACLKAQRSILIVGWDIDSRTRLVGGDSHPADGYPTEFIHFLTELVQARPGLRIHLLLWDYSLLYAGERELLPRLSLGWRTPERITLRLDNSVPFGSSQHQKIVVIDDAVALSGGLDLTIRRWDTPDHKARNRERVDPAGRPYRPFHDVQMMVDGAAAHALALLARQRWCRVEGGQPLIEPIGDPWPEAVKPDFTEVEIGIARTQPRYNGDREVRESEALFLDSIDRAERSIYIENQFATSPLIARRLARQLRRRPGLEVVIVAPRSHDSWIERRTMRNGRIRFWRRLRAAGEGRVRLLYPAVEQDGNSTDTMIHSKIMVIDDHLLRVGSANLNNRSMGADTECDLVIEAQSDGERTAITEMRNRLLGEHCGVGAEEVAAALARHGSLVAAADGLSRNGHRLRPIEDGVPDQSALAAAIERVADPSRPLRLDRALHLPALHLPGRATLAAVAIGLVALAVVLAWYFTPLSHIASPGRMAAFFADGAGQPWAPALVLLAFLVGGAVAFPVNILILATAATFGPWLGLLYSSAGAAISALAMYAAGAHLGREAVDRRLGPRWQRALERIRQRGVLAVVAVRVLPIAPFTVINLAAGASRIRLADFLIGTALGLAPGLVLLSVAGDSIVHVLAHPSVGQVGLLILCVALWIALSFGVQAVLSRRRGRAS